MKVYVIKKKIIIKNKYDTKCVNNIEKCSFRLEYKTNKNNMSTGFDRTHRQVTFE